VTAWPGDQGAGAAGGGYLRASDADRERVVDALKGAFVQGLLTKDELGMRAGQALAARTCGELAAITAGIPVQPPRARPSPQVVRSAPAHDRKPVRVRKLAGWGACAILVPTSGAAFLTYYGGFFVLFALTFIMTVVTSTSGPVRTGARRRW
jgi:Domain of unknown function (DUF1707)